MPTFNSSVEYSANSRSSNVNIVYHDSESQQNGNSTQTNLRSNLKKGECPTLFERSSNKWWNLRFDSKVLEDQFKISALLQFKNLFRHSVISTCLSCGILAIYFAASQLQYYWIAGLVWALVFACFSVIFLILSKQDKFYNCYSTYLITTFILFLAVTGLVSAYYVQKVFSIVGSYFVGSVVILLMYLNLPFPIPVLFSSAVIFSVVFEILLQIGLSNLTAQTVISHILLLLCLHVIGIQMIVNLQIVRHSTFWKLCLLVKSTETKQQEETFKTIMIKTVMPLSVAEKLMLRNDDIDQDLKEPRSNGKKKIKEESMFRPFTMERMDNVSILYADIVGFTQMSSNKTAAELVQLLNNLFGRFDSLCQVTGCEKISTLGDCYYCVAGCPVARPDHAACCVEMGLGMVTEIKEFCKQNNINVNMRVGIHTGYVLCGVVGTRRYKFDVWSNDVSLANGMEQHGIPGRVHVSKATLDCLDNKYIVEDSKLEERDASFKEKTGTTYLIVRRNDESDAGNAKENGGGPNNNLESNASTKEPLLTKQPAVSNDNDKANDPTIENVEPSRNPPSTSRADQLSQLLEQHFIPIPIPSSSAMIKMRKEEDDHKFIQSVKDDPIMCNAYANKRINHFTLWFDSSKVGKSYHNLFTKEVKKDEILEYAISPRYRLFWDIVISTVFTLLLFVSSILLLSSPTSHPTWIIVFIVLFVLLIICTIVGGAYVRHVSDFSKSSLHSFFIFLSRWHSRHFLGLLFLLIPAAVIFSHVNQQTSPVSDCSTYILLFLFVIVHFLNFDQLSTYFRFLLSIAVGVGALLMAFIPVCPSAGNSANSSTCPCFLSSQLKYELIVDVILVILFVAIINRHFELLYKLDFFVDDEIKSKFYEIKKEKMKVEQLLKNFIPPHVRGAMQDQPLYSKTHTKVGVIFATIVNFNELYEESFEGGKEFLRFLSELISDVDDLLNDKKYKDIEKIKTIGTTFMLASGLNPDVDQESTGADSHLCRLMEFCIEMQNVVDRFNQDMLNFHLVLRIGFNHGEVTAGVIGTTKRLYDIWGDTVNIASRMDSTGVPNRVQVSEGSMEMLKGHFNFSYLGEKFVKGKGQMRTYLLVREDEETRKIIPNPTDNYRPFT